jgi:AcrR family transcriptional regulator
MSAARSTRDRRPVLTRERVIAAALVLVDRDGLGGLSMRRLAGELGVEAMSLYHHVRDKSEVIDGIVAAVLDEIVVVDEGSWRERAHSLAVELRRVVRAHPHVHLAVIERGIASPAVARPAAALVGALAEGGLEGDDLVDGFWTLLAFVSGSLSCELAERPSVADDSALPEEFFGRDVDAQFDRGLHAVLDAVTA